MSTVLGVEPRDEGFDGIGLVRNPEFDEWSAAAQPDGFVDAISWRFNQGLASAFDRLSAGDLDWMADSPMPEDLASLQAAHPDQVVLSASPGTIYVGFDLRKPPFDDVRVRQALSYAIDRDHVVELLGGSTSWRTTCQILPPNFPGYQPFCPYTLEPEGGVWSAPDLDRARALIEDADAIGKEVTVWVMKEDPLLVDPVKTMRYVVEVLNELGLRADLKVVRVNEYWDTLYGGPASSGDHPQVYLGGWASDYLGSATFIADQFKCGAPNNISGLCSDSLDAKIEEAQRLQATNLAASNDAWAEIEHRLVEDAVWASLTNPISAYAFSARTENIQVHPQWGILLSRLWVQ
jgi:peptide/nickel transport system substrate-binding protein